MKKNIPLLLMLGLLFTLACGHNVEKTGEQNYISASLKNQPRIIYPKDAQENSFSGMTRLILSISDEGAVVKVFLEKSSGYEMLDKAAIEYCKNLVFIPARLDDKTIYSRLRWDIKFNISSEDWITNRYINEINDLYNSLLQSTTPERNQIQRTILTRHIDFVSKMTDALNFNMTSEQVILPKISEEWKKDWNKWPLTFLLYHDFLVRFPDYDSLANVKAQLLKSLKDDILYIRNTPATSNRVQKEKENIFIKIKSFITSHYPDLFIDDPGLNNINDLRSIKFQQSYTYR